MARTITSANSEFRLTIPGVFSTAKRLEGYATDDAFMSENVQTAETMMGVDGKMSSGWTPYIFVQTVTLQASSPSIDDFNLWIGAEQVSREIFQAQGVILLPSIGRSYVLTNGTLHDARLMPDAKRVLQAVQYVIHWEGHQVLPVA